MGVHNGGRGLCGGLAHRPGPVLPHGDGVSDRRAAHAVPAASDAGRLAAVWPPMATPGQLRGAHRPARRPTPPVTTGLSRFSPGHRVPSEGSAFSRLLLAALANALASLTRPIIRLWGSGRKRRLAPPAPSGPQRVPRVRATPPAVGYGRTTLTPVSSRCATGTRHRRSSPGRPRQYLRYNERTGRCSCRYA